MKELEVVRVFKYRGRIYETEDQLTDAVRARDISVLGRSLYACAELIHEAKYGKRDPYQGGGSYGADAYAEVLMTCFSADVLDDFIEKNPTEEPRQPSWSGPVKGMKK